MYRPSCVTVVYFPLKKMKIHIQCICCNKMMMEMSRCRPEPTKYYIKLVVSQVGQEIMPNTVGEFHF